MTEDSDLGKRYAIENPCSKIQFFRKFSAPASFISLDFRREQNTSIVFITKFTVMKWISRQGDVNIFTVKIC
jgi:hypothetical protein